MKTLSTCARRVVRHVCMNAEHPITAASRRRQAAWLAAAGSASRRMQSLHVLLTRWWAQMEAPPQSLQMLLRPLLDHFRKG